jgi:serine/threonine protein kinase
MGVHSFSLGLLAWVLIFKPALAFNTQDILGAALQIHENECRAPLLPEAEVSCKALSEKISILKYPAYQETLDELLATMKPSCFRCREEFVDLIRNWTKASEQLPGYDLYPLLPLILCIENGKSTWERYCKNSHLYSGPNGEYTVPPPLHHCEISTPTAVLPVQINYDSSCSKIYLRMGNDILGTGNYKTAYRMYEYRNWQDVAYIRFHIDYERLNQEQRQQVDQELSVLEKIKGLDLIGLPKVLHADRHRIIVERFEGQLGKGDGEIPPLGPEKWKHAVSQLNAGLAYLHGLGLLHNDIKPENVLASYRTDPSRPMRAVYTDVGLSDNVRALCEGNKKMPYRHSKGTPVNMAPEQFHRDFHIWPGKTCEEIERNAQKTDVFSHAMIVYRLKFGKNLPWFSEACLNGGIASFVKCQNAMIPYLTKILRESTDAVDRLLARALDINPFMRVTAAEFQSEFELALKSPPTQNDDPYSVKKRPLPPLEPPLRASPERIVLPRTAASPSKKRAENPMTPEVTDQPAEDPKKHKQVNLRE